ncbi:MAG: pyridoxal phosphate-dependent aminotransferase [Herpetosiphon sp.]
MPGFFAQDDLSPNVIELGRVRQAAAGGYIDLTSANPTEQGLLFPSEVLEEASRIYLHDRHYAPDPRGLPATRDAIQRYYSSRTPPLDLGRDDIVVTASTSESYSLLLALLCDPGDNILVPQVTYPLFEYFAAMHHVRLRPYQLREADGWSIDQMSLLQQADERSRAVFIVSPHNPTGMVIQQPLEALIQLRLPVICDEVFASFTYSVPATPPLGTLYTDLPVFHLNGISKMFGLPDLKCGWIALNIAARRFSARLELLNDTFLSSSTLIQSMLPSIFQHGSAFVETQVDRVRSNIAFALQTFQHHQVVDVQAPQGGYYLFLRVARWTDEDALVLYLLELGVLVHPGYFFGSSTDAHLVLSALVEPTRFRSGIETLARALL